MWEGKFALKCYDKDNKLKWTENVHNELAHAGEFNILDSYFRDGTGSAPLSFEIALLDETPQKTARVKDLRGEPVSNGYNRQGLTRDSIGWPNLIVNDGSYTIISKIVQFSAFGGSWGPITTSALISKGIDIPTGLGITAYGNTSDITYGYRVVAISDDDGETLACEEVQIQNGFNILSDQNYNALSWNPVAGAKAYKVYRVTTAGLPNTTGYLATVYEPVYYDMGAPGDLSPIPFTDTSGKLIAYGVLTQAHTVSDGQTLDVQYQGQLR